MMRIIGITGQAGSGKSLALEYMKYKYNAAIAGCDTIGRKFQEKDEEGYRLIVETFGNSILSEDKTLNRKKIAELIYSDENKRSIINCIIHPLVKSKIKLMIKEAEKSGTNLFVIESAIIIEAGYSDLYKELWYIFCKEDVRIKRLMQTRGYSLEKCKHIFSSQLSDEEFKIKSDIIIDNSGTPDFLYKQIDMQLKEN